jgi:hypothetical protein
MESDFHVILTGLLQSMGIEAGHIIYPVILLVISEFLGFRKSAKSNNTPQLLVNIGRSLVEHFFNKNKSTYEHHTNKNHLKK